MDAAGVRGRQPLRLQSQDERISPGPINLTRQKLLRASRPIARNVGRSWNRSKVSSVNVRDPRLTAKFADFSFDLLALGGRQTFGFFRIELIVLGERDFVLL